MTVHLPLLLLLSLNGETSATLSHQYSSLQEYHQIEGDQDHRYLVEGEAPSTEELAMFERAERYTSPLDVASTRLLPMVTSEAVEVDWLAEALRASCRCIGFKGTRSMLRRVRPSVFDLGLGTHQNATVTSTVWTVQSSKLDTRKTYSAAEGELRIEQEVVANREVLLERWSRTAGWEACTPSLEVDREYSYLGLKPAIGGKNETVVLRKARDGALAALCGKRIASAPSGFERLFAVPEDATEAGESSRFALPTVTDGIGEEEASALASIIVGASSASDERRLLSEHLSESPDSRWISLRLAVFEHALGTPSSLVGDADAQEFRVLLAAAPTPSTIARNRALVSRLEASSFALSRWADYCLSEFQSTRTHVFIPTVGFW